LAHDPRPSFSFFFIFFHPLLLVIVGLYIGLVTYQPRDYTGSTLAQLSKAGNFPRCVVLGPPVEKLTELIMVVVSVQFNKPVAHAQVGESESDGDVLWGRLAVGLTP
jgi:hypothetical protein